MRHWWNIRISLGSGNQLKENIDGPHVEHIYSPMNLRISPDKHNLASSEPTNIWPYIHRSYIRRLVHRLTNKFIIYLLL
jgi:hypothetical protein